MTPGKMTPARGHFPRGRFERSPRATPSQPEQTRASPSGPDRAPASPSEPDRAGSRRSEPGPKMTPGKMALAR
eukprot:7750352-Alexandrium_andersonii.AAC.1